MKPKRRFLKKRRNLRRLLGKLSWLVLTSLFLALAWLGLSSSFFKISRLDCFVNGERCSREIWARVFNLVAGKSAISFSESFLEKRVKEEYFQFQKVEIEIEFPNTLVLNLFERQPLAVFGLADTLWLVDEEGIVLGEADEKINLPKVLAEASEEIEISTGVDLDQFSFGPSLEIIRLLLEKELVFDSGEVDKKLEKMVLFSSGWEAIFSLQKEAKIQVDSLQLILARAKIEGKLLKLIDLRFDKPIINFK